jgi:hypothetical protein
MTGTSAGAPFDSPGARDQDAAHAEAQRPAMSCGTLSPTITASPAAHAGLAQAFLEDRGVRLHVAVIRRGDRDREQTVEREVLLERLQRALRVRDEADREAVACSARSTSGTSSYSVK